MRAYVYTDKSLERYAGRFVWLSINTENSKNAEFLAKYKIAAIPTLLILDPSRDAISFRYVGSATVPQLSKMLDDVQRRNASPSDALVASADRLSSEGKDAEAAKLYQAALDKAPRNWRRYGRTAESLLFALSGSDQNAQCTAAAETLYPRLKTTTSGANIAAMGLGCATSIDEKSADRSRLITQFEKRTRQALDDPRLDLSGDDRSGLYISLIDARDAMKDEEGAGNLRRAWAAFLEGAAARAKTAEQRAVYDSHRLSAYIALSTPEKAIPMLEQSQRDFADDYNPPARLAAAYKAMKQYDKALEASSRALNRVYGPRKITVLRSRAEIYTAMGDKDSARKTIAEAVDYAKSLPTGQRSDKTIASLEKKLTDLMQ